MNLTVSAAVQLPVYVPSEEEAREPALYAKNVRAYMVRRPNLSLELCC